MVNVFEYTDYRKYLTDYFKAKKAENPKFSHRFLAKQLGFSTSNFMMLVMQGKRNLNKSTCFKVSNVFKHSKKEAEYFENLVFFQQAKNHDEKDKYFAKMKEFWKKLRIDIIEEWQYEYYSNWYNPIIRELITQNGFNGNFAILGRKLLPSITGAQAKKSAMLLERLGLIKKRGVKYVQSSRVISTGPEVNSLAIINFHRKMAELASEAYNRTKREERDITSCTLHFSENSMQKIKDEIDRCRKKVLEIASEDNKADRVYQANFQLFPVSKKSSKEIK